MLLINGTTLRQEALRERLKLLTEEKCDLQTQLTDCHLRIEQEGKVQFADLPADRAQRAGLTGKSHDIGWFCFIIFQTSCFAFFQVIKQYLPRTYPSLAKDWKKIWLIYFFCILYSLASTDVKLNPHLRTALPGPGQNALSSVTCFFVYCSAQ